MFKRIIAGMAVLATVAAVQAAKVPFSDPFGAGGPVADWASDTDPIFFNGSLGVVTTSDLDWRGVTVNAPAGDGSFGKLSNAPSAAGTAWRLVGDGTEKDITIQTKMFTPNVNTAVAPDDFLYQIVIFNQNASGYSRCHFQFNQDVPTLPAPRVRVQAGYPTLTSYLILTSPTNFTVAEKWWDVKLVINNTNSTCEVFLDGVSRGIADCSAQAAGFNLGGKFGFGEYIDGDTAGVARSVYVDAFSVTANANVSDWSAYE